jgi:cyclopropane-fatty-acyl-phospholipid synthase
MSTNSAIGTGTATVEKNQREAKLLHRLQERLQDYGPHPTLKLTFPDASSYTIGEGQEAVEIIFTNGKAVTAGLSFDELRFAEAYLDGDIDIKGSMYDLLLMRSVLTDKQPLIQFMAFVYRRLLDTTSWRKKWIGFHYDEDPQLFFNFLDTEHRCYSHGYFESEDESLETAMGRKLGFAFAATELGPGKRVLDIGGGWGSFTRFAGSRGAEVTSLTISQGQREYLEELIAAEQLPCRVLLEDVYEYAVPESERYDAIVNLGVTEHLSNYPLLISQYRKLLKPGGKIYFDSCASRDMYDVGSYINKHIFPGCTSYFCLHEFMTEIAKTDFEVELVANDRRNYMLTTIKWAENLERNRDAIISSVGKQTYRRFRMLIWACAAGFSLDEISAYHVVLRG